ncbi:nucleotidyltransferase family protein [Pedobacter sp. AW31-3R]|uniref:nucleotidyltransferase family protein n=1 Tax=Pedobacter sp. AW31-3R TaxID=3445781 RepID=UPI003F9ED42C
MKPTLLILAGGMASRYGSMKQIDGFGPNDETIIDYSIYDAIKAGFGKVVFIIKEEFVENFKAIFDAKLHGKIATDYVFQNFDLQQFGIDLEIDRTKPWGTGHAILAARYAIKEPFCLINADDFYGLDAFEKMHEFLTEKVSPERYSMIGYEISKTLSDHGAVSRGICRVSAEGYLEDIVERTKVLTAADRICYEEDNHLHPLSTDTLVSMNFWGFTPEVFPVAEELFREFVQVNQENLTAEFYIPTVAETLLHSGKVDFKVIPTGSQWFGVTYKEDKPIAQASIDQLIKDGLYPANLWN